MHAFQASPRQVHMGHLVANRESNASLHTCLKETVPGWAVIHEHPQNQRDSVVELLLGSRKVLDTVL